MKQSRLSNRFGLLVVFAVVFALMIAPASAFGQAMSVKGNESANSAGSAVTSEGTSAAEQKATLAFWTRDQITKAKPMMMIDRTGAADPDTMAAVEEALSMPSGSSPSGSAAVGADQVARAAFPNDWKSGADNASPYAPDGTSQVYTSYIVNSWAPAQLIYPHKWIGRFSFTTPNGTSYCSATATSNNTLVTAAHCVYDTPSRNQWYTNKVFIPAYRNGNAPYGTFPTAGCYVLTAWVNLSGSFSINGWTKYDLAVCKMGKNAAGQTLNGAVGWAGRSWNYGYVNNVFNLGYPWNNYQNVGLTDAGKYLRTCTAETFQQTTDTLGEGCNWGPGISGGPWLRSSYAPPAVSGQVNSVNSGLYIGTQNLYGIRFNSNNIAVLCQSIYANC